MSSPRFIIFFLTMSRVSALGVLAGVRLDCIFSKFFTASYVRALGVIAVLRLDSISDKFFLYFSFFSLL